MCALTVLPGKLSIHPTDSFIIHAKRQVTLPISTPNQLPPSTILISPNGTNSVAKGNTIRLVSRKYVLTCQKLCIVMGKVPSCAAIETMTMPTTQLSARLFQSCR